MEKFLADKYSDLPGSKPVEKAVQKKIREGEKGPSSKEERIEAYLERLESLALDAEKTQPRKMLGAESRPRALSLLREMVMNKYVRPNKEKMAQGAGAVEERAGRELGINVHYNQETLEQRGEIAVTDLEKSLDNWISYLSDMNEPYPTWFRYYAFRNILDLGDYDKDKGEFTKRSRGSARLFPDIDRGALAYVEQTIEASKDSKILERLQTAQRTIANGSIPEDQLITREKSQAFAKLPFAKQYAEGIKQAGEITPEMRAETRGEWVKYQQGTDPTALWASLQNKGTAWCTKGFGTAETQLKGGDFYVYYTLDKQGNPVIPRLAIRMNGQKEISNDVRGVLDSKQNVEGNMMPILEEKLKDFGPEADKYQKKSSDMKRLTEIDQKTTANQPLTKDDLLFLYEVNSTIEGFGYEKDPRIAEIRAKRNVKEDLPILFDCTPEQIATTAEKITKDTLAYIGPITKESLKLLSTKIEHIYTRFPDQKVFLKEIAPDSEITSAETAVKKLEKAGHKIGDYAKDMLTKVNWGEKLKSSYEIISISVGELFGDTNTHIYADIKVKAKEQGLDLVPAVLAPEIRLNYDKNGQYTVVAMEAIRDRDGSPALFGCYRFDSDSWLGSNRGHDGSRWFSDSRFFFVR